MNQSSKYEPLIQSMIKNDIFSSLGIAHSAALYVQQNEPLSVRGFAKINTVVTSLSGIIRTMLILNDIIENENSEKPPVLRMDYCSIDSFFGSIVRELNHLFAGGVDAEFKYISKLDKNRTFYININTIERIIYGLIYCFVKNLSETDKKEIKITFDEGSDKIKNYIVTITAGGKPIDKKYADIFKILKEVYVDYFDIDSISLYNINEIAKSILGSIKYVNTKTMNKFIFTFPHLTGLDGGEIKEVIDYTPNIDLMRIYFCDLISM